MKKFVMQFHFRLIGIVDCLLLLLLLLLQIIVIVAGGKEI